ncbi:TPA: RHS repeat domain-containing protein, partial [Pseudomonas aeruginosa]
SYAYDAVGNRTQRSDNPASGGTASSQDYQYAPDSNRLTAIGAQAVTSDAAGNLTQDRAARKLAYDAQGRLQSVSRDGQQVAEYRYNALGQRIVKLTPESVTTYLYGPDGQLLGEAEHDGSGRKLRAQYYLWLDSLPLATIDADYDAQGKVGNPTLLYLHGDHLDTPRLATDASGQIAWQWQSDAFGRGEALSQGSTQVNLRFPGQYYDAESGLHYNYFRDYDPETGRYVESDPIGLTGGLNTFGYVTGNPINYFDPNGLCGVGSHMEVYWDRYNGLKTRCILNPPPPNPAAKCLTAECVMRNGDGRDTRVPSNCRMVCRATSVPCGILGGPLTPAGAACRAAVSSTACYMLCSPYDPPSEDAPKQCE